MNSDISPAVAGDKLIRTASKTLIIVIITSGDINEEIACHDKPSALHTHHLKHMLYQF